MVTELSTTALKNDELMTVSRLQCPESDWTERVSPFLGHKGGIWNWQVRETLVGPIEPLDARYYLGTIGADIVGNICIFIYHGVGILGHVFTSPDYRRKGICKTIMTALFNDFIDNGGQALFLGTGFDSPPWHIYKSFGFEPMYSKSGEMEWYRNDIDDFEETWFSSSEVLVRDADWRDWPGTTALMCNRKGGLLRNVSLQIYNRSSMEHAYLELFRNVLKRNDTSASVLESATTGATLGLASVCPDPRFPGTYVLDLFVHPNFSGESNALLAALPLGEIDGKINAYVESSDDGKSAALESAGFNHLATLARQIQLDTGVSDIAIMGRE